MKFIRDFIKRALCLHRFIVSDLHTVEGAPSHKRVAWPCCKCGKVFRAHCGLDISPRFGRVTVALDRSDLPK